MSSVPSTTSDVLGPAGPLSGRITGFEPRAGQVEMAAAVERALRVGEILVCEAGTGTGKTLAYLVPALQSGKKVIISTATRALQEQIWRRDLPLVSSALGVPAHAALMKGLANYVCLRRLSEFQARPDLSPGEQQLLARLRNFVEESEAGDLADLPSLSERQAALSEISASSETRVGPGCAYYDRCFVTRMKQRAEDARVVVVNHHLFFADLALRGSHPGRVLPDYDAVIFDEAHQLEDIATQFFGIRVSQSRIDRIALDFERALTRAGFGSPEASRNLTAQLRSANTRFWQEVQARTNSPEPRSTVESDAWYGAPNEAWHALDGALEAAAACLELARRSVPSDRSGFGAEDPVTPLASRIEQVRADLGEIIASKPGRVAWLDISERNAALSASPIDIASLLKERLFEVIPSIVLTSATLADGSLRTERASSRGGASNASALAAPAERSPFSYLRRRLGLDDPALVVREAVVPSPFDYARRALLYTPRDLPLPSDGSFVAEVADRAAQLIELTGGGAFVLTTSFRSMHALGARLRESLSGRLLLVQGERPKTALLDAFRADGNAVLIATMSFWEGVDVPGKALRLVILDKIPFSVPSDPIVRARSLALEAEGGNPFMQLHVPTAALTLKQGFGRLIRSSRDSGIVALLDPRVHRKSYGKRLLDALPPARRVTDFTLVRAFWEEQQSNV